MRRRIFYLIGLLLPLFSLAQNYNPFVAQGIISPAPLASVQSNGTGQASFVVGNSGTDALLLVTGQEMKLTISLSSGVPDNVNPIAAISGTFASYFTWTYDAFINTYTGTQNQAIPGGLTGAGTIIIAYKVTNNSPKASPQNGFNVNITPPPYSNGINTVGDDAVSSYTWTTYALSGTVFLDLDGSTDSQVDGSGTNAGGMLFVSAVDAGNSVISTVAVAADGIYTLTGLDGGTYSIVLHTNPSGSTTASVPNNWVNTGEGTALAGDGTPDGVTSVTVTNVNVTGVNFGVEQYPFTDDHTLPAQTNPGSTTSVSIPAGTFSGFDPDGGIISQIHIISFPTNATSITINGTTYTSGTFPVGGVFVPTNAAGNPTQPISVDPNVDGPVNVVITYAVIDNAGKEDQTPGNATIQFAAASADLSIDKTVSDPSPNVGSNVQFTLTVGNSGPSAATGVTVSDLLPSGYTYVSHNTLTGTYVPVTGVWTIGALPSSTNVTLTIIATVNATGNYNNSASVTSTTSDPNPANNNDDATTTPTAQSDVSINKTVNNSTPNVGSNVVFTLIVTNNGPSTATGVSVMDMLPSGYTYVSDDGAGAYVANFWTIGTLLNGASATLNITATVNAIGDYTNTASVNSVTADPNAANNTDDATTTPAQSDVSINKAVDNSTPKVGSNVVFTITVTNNGPNTATVVSVTDILPSGYTYVSDNGAGAYVSGTGVWTVGSLANEGNASLIITATVNATGNYTNTATVTSTTYDPNASNNTDTESTSPVPQSDVSINKTVNNSSPNVGDQVTFTITVTNNGPSAATGVSVTDQLPTGYTYVSDNGAGAYVSGTGIWTVGGLANGASASLTITAVVNASGNYTNSATVSSSTADPNAANNTDTESTTPGAQADVSINKTVNNSTPNVGSNVVFTITVTNNGPSAATGVSVSDLLPTGYTYVSDNGAGAYVSGTGVWTVGGLANGASASLAITATVNATGNYANTATVSSTTTDPTPGNNTDTESTTPVAQSDVSINKTVNNNTPNVGSNVVFTLTVTNNGPSAATGVSVTDQLPSGYTYVSDNGAGAYVSGTGIWTVGGLANGASASLAITATVNATGNYTNTATVSSTTADPTPGNNTDTESTTPVPQSDVSINKTVNNSTPNVGDQVTFTVTVTNNGPSAAIGVSVTDQLPTGYTYVSDNGAGAYVSGTGVWTVGGLANGASATLTVTATVNATGNYTNSATVSSTTVDPTPGNNTDTESTTPGAQSDVQVVKQVDNPIQSVGGNVVFTITVTNNGPSGATNVQVNDLLPSGFDYVSDLPSVGTYNEITGVWTVGSLANGASATLIITATVKATVGSSRVDLQACKLEYSIVSPK